MIITQDELDSFRIEDMTISEILDEDVANNLGIKEGYQILKINGNSIPKRDLKDFLNSDDIDEFEFELQVIENSFLSKFSFETQPLENRTVKLYRTKLHNEKPEYFQIVRKQFPVRLTYSMTINKAQGIHSFLMINMKFEDKRYGKWGCI